MYVLKLWLNVTLKYKIPFKKRNFEKLIKLFHGGKEKEEKGGRGREGGGKEGVRNVYIGSPGTHSGCWD